MPVKSNLSWVVPGVALILAGSVAAQQPPEVRRVVTKIDASGKAVVMLDGKVQLTSFRTPNPASGKGVTPGNPPDFSLNDDRPKTQQTLVPPKNGTIFRIVDFGPTNKKIESMDI